MTKPFSPRELVARVRAILRRASQVNKEDIDFLKYASIEMYYKQRRVLLGGKELVLTPKEFDLCGFLPVIPDMFSPGNRF